MLVVRFQQIMLEYEAVSPLPAFAPAVAPDYGQALAYFTALFPDAGMLHFRAVPEPKDDRPPTNHHYALGPKFADDLAGFLDYCAVEQRAAFVLPGYVNPGGTGKKDVIALPAVLVDFDKGDAAGALRELEATIGPATVVVESGGVNEFGPKLHAYWKLKSDETALVDQICGIREQLAREHGGDTAFKQAAQVIRIPGSVHFKGAPKLVKLLQHRAATYGLAEFPAPIGAAQAPLETSANPGGFNFDFSRDVEPANTNSVDRVMTQTVRSEGQDDITRFEAAGVAIGQYLHEVRQGRISQERAWELAKGWNKTILLPPWDEGRLRGDFERLVAIDIAKHGQLPVIDMTRTAATGGSLLDWRADTYEGLPPARQWLVEGLLPAGAAGVLAAVGDAGKSMLALRLALSVACDPLPVDAANGLLGPIGAPTFFGQPITGRGAAVVLTAEDDRDEVHRRIHALDPTNTRKGKPLYVLPMLSIGGARSIITDSPTGPVPTPFWTELRDQLTAIPDLKLVVLDPLSHFVGADTNDNTIATKTMSLVAELATATGATVMLVHHLAKGRVPTNLTDARTAIRGAGAFVDNGRWAVVIWEADPKDAKGILKSLGQDKRHSAGIVYMGGLAKGNAPGEKSLRTLIRNGVTGLLEDHTNALKAANKRGDRDDAVFAVLKAERLVNDKFQFGVSKNVLWKAWRQLLVSADITVRQEDIEELADRLVSQGKLVKTLGNRGGYALYEPNID